MPAIQIGHAAIEITAPVKTYEQEQAAHPSTAPAAISTGAAPAPVVQHKTTTQDEAAQPAADVAASK